MKHYLKLSASIFALFFGPAVRGVEPESLLPKSTLVYLSVPNALELRERFSETSVGKMWQSAPMAAFRQEVSQNQQDFSGALKKTYGLDEQQIMEAASGRVVIAGLLTKRQEVSFSFFIELENQETGEKLIASAVQEITRRGANKAAETLPVPAQIFNMPEAGEQLVYVQRDEYLLVSGDLDNARDICQQWLQPQPENSLSQDQAFQNALKQTEGEGEKKESLTFFLAPIPFAVAADTNRKNRESASLELTNKDEDSQRPPFPMRHGFPAIQGLAARMWVDHQPFEMLSRLAVYAPQPHEMAMQMLDFPSGGVTVPDFVPASVSSCTVMHWNLEAMINHIADLADDITDSPGAFQETIEDLDSELNVHLQTELFPLLSDHLTLMSQMSSDQKTERTAVAIDIRDPAANENKVASMIYSLMVEDTETRRTRVPGIKHDLWVMRLTVGEEGASFSGAAMMVAEGKLWLSTHAAFIEELLRGKNSPSLTSSEVFRDFETLWQGFSQGKLIGRTFARGDQSFRHTYQTLRNGGVEALSGAEGVLTAVLYQVLREMESDTDYAKLPDFEAIRSFFGTYGIVSKNSESGWQVLVGNH